MARLYYQLYALGNKPDGLYPQAVRYLIKSALPFAFMGSIPARALTGRMDVSEYFLVFFVLLGYVGLSVLLWKKGLKRYQSASS